MPLDPVPKTLPFDPHPAMTGNGAGARAVVPSVPLLESKVHVPAPRPGIVDRTAILQRLLRADCESVVSVVAPAGYGKTTVLAQWAAHRQPRVAWISADEHDNDPTVLLTGLAVALNRIEPIDPRVFRSRSSPTSGLADVAHLVASIEAMSQPVALVIDQVEAVTDRASRDVIGELASRLPDGSQLAIGSRHELPVPVARLRAQRRIVEITAEDLAMDGHEARSLMAAAGVEFADEDLVELVDHTEGWPAGLYLAALAIGSRRTASDFTFTLTGDDRFIGDYLQQEFLERLSPTDASFLSRTSILDRLSGALCDATLGISGSSDVLNRLEQKNLLVVPLDRRREWYRYHHLLRELLQTQLVRHEPEIIPALHRRAATWYEDNDQPEAAILHAQNARDAERVARLVLKNANPVWATGRVETVLGWMDWFLTGDLLERYPAVAVHGALMHALVGKAGDAERWAAAAERTTFTGMQADGNTMEASLAYLRALLCRDGLDAMRRDAQLALGGLSPTSPYRASMLHAEGQSHLLQGDLDTADALFARALDEATSAGVVPFVPVLMAQRGIVATERDDWSEAATLAEHALAGMQDGHFDDYWTSAFVYAWAARTASNRGDAHHARELAKRAARVRPLLTYAIPVLAVQALLELARTYVALGDPGGVRAILRQIDEILLHRPRLGSLPDDVNDLRTKLDRLRGEMVGASSLTTAELRLVPLLPTHLSFVDISERLFVSRHTVKTQAISIYRKLGVSSRGEAITRMHELGLIEHA
jgi:LuxR family transcriptional regulator, maltose regulon positive regulatory protein